jgi:hypothetical protein
MSWQTISLIALFVLNILATARIFRGDLLTTQQRATQTLLIWLVPIVGAIVCLIANTSADPVRDRTRDPNFDPADAQWDVVPPGPGSGDGD